MVALDESYDWKLDLRERKDCANVTFARRSYRTSHDVRDHPDGSLSSIFSNKVHLEKVYLHAYGYAYGDGKRERGGAIATLVNQNPKLSHVHLDGIRVTDAALTSLVQLQHLTHVTLKNKNEVTTAGVLTLLRRASRYVVRKITIFNANVDEEQVTRETGMMCKKQMTFDNRSTSNLIDYEIHA